MFAILDLFGPAIFRKRRRTPKAPQSPLSLIAFSGQAATHKPHAWQASAFNAND
jgi:hypothetical protein